MTQQTVTNWETDSPLQETNVQTLYSACVRPSTAYANVKGQYRLRRLRISSCGTTLNF